MTSELDHVHVETSDTSDRVVDENDLLVVLRDNRKTLVSSLRADG